MFGSSSFTNLIVAFIKLITLGIFFISAAILYFSKGLARLIENVYKAYKVEKDNKQKELEKELEKLKENLDNQQLQNLDKKIIDKLELEKSNKQKELQNKKR